MCSSEQTLSILTAHFLHHFVTYNFNFKGCYILHYLVWIILTKLGKWTFLSYKYWTFLVVLKLTLSQWSVWYNLNIHCDKNKLNIWIFGCKNKFVVVVIINFNSYMLRIKLDCLIVRISLHFYPFCCKNKLSLFQVKYKVDLFFCKNKLGL